MAKKQLKLTVLTIAISCAISTSLLAADPVDSKKNKKILEDTQKKQQAAAKTNPISNNGTLPPNVTSSKQPQQTPLVTVLAAPPHGRVFNTANLGRFGDFRWRKGVASYHEGIDIASGSKLPLKAPWAGTTRNTYGSGWVVGIERNDSKARLEYMHVEGNIGNNKVVKPGDQVALESGIGSSGKKEYGIHLHLQYNAAPGEKMFDVWLGQRGYAGKGSFGTNAVQGPYMKNSNGVPMSIRHKNGRSLSDPTPNLSFDVHYSGDAATRYGEYLGNTARQQFNLLYGTNMPLNVPFYGPAGIKTPTKSFPAVTKIGSWDSVAAGAANMSSVNGALFADTSGYSAGGSYVSYQVLTSFLSSDDGKEFGTLPGLANPANVNEMSMKQIVENIGTSRYGNPEWNKAMVGLSSKALMTEYLMMTSEENFLKEEIQKLRNRVEMLTAGLTIARMHDYSKKVQELQIIAEADAIPKVLNYGLEAKGDEYAVGYTYQAGSPGTVDMGALPNDMEGIKHALLGVIFQAESSHGEGGWNASNNGTVKGKDVIACSRASGGVFNLTSMTLGQMKKIYRDKNVNTPVSVNDCSHLFAAGRYQIVAGTFRNAQHWTGLPDSALFTPENQTKMAESLLMYRVGKLLRNQGQSVEDAKLRLAQEWSSLGIPNGTCNTSKDRMPSYYSQGNAASCSVTYKVWALLEQADKINKGKK